MARFLFYIVPALIISVSAAVYEDCEVPPSVKNANLRIEDEEDTIRVIYSCQNGYELRGDSELLCDLDTDEWNGNPPECIRLENDNEVDYEEVEENAAKAKKKKHHDIPEDRMVSPALASTLDMSCIQAKVKAPEIRHGYVKKYDRRRRGDKIFLAAFYACNDNFEFEDSEINALYCGGSKWNGELPVCIAIGEYTEGEEEEYEEYIEETEEGNGAKVAPASAAQAPSSATEEETTAHVPEGTSNEIPKVERDHTEPHESSEGNNEIEEAHHVVEANRVTEVPPVVASTTDPYTPRVIDDNCGSDNGGCDHKCERVLFPGENEPRIKCSCTEGFSLDPYDYSTCRDINECAIKNGGCEQLCENLPGSFQCTCESGLQINTLTGNTCVDINECESPEIVAECHGACENTHGSYRCIVPLNNLDDVEEVTNETTPEIIRTSEELECNEGYKAEDGKCADIDECSEGTSGCEICVNIEGGYECTCPAGFDLADDGKACIDVDECAIVVEENEYEASHKMCSHGCQNTIGSFKCNCPERQHLSSDGRTCTVDACIDVQNMKLNKTRCAYECVDLPGGSYQCVCPDGYGLTEDGFNCQEVRDVCSEHKNSCDPGTCQASDDGSTFSCICPLGYKEIDSKCVDIDECSSGVHKCSHDCFNTEGNYRCECPTGFSFAKGSDNECEDINECVLQPGVCGSLNCINIAGAFVCLCSDGSEPNIEGLCSEMLEDPCKEHRCSHECLADGRGFRCACPGNMTLDDTGINCEEADLCSFNNNGCEQICKSEANGLCDCYEGFILDGNGKSCIDIDECQVNNGGCHQLCTNFAGGFKCSCQKGFEFLDGTLKDYCFDIDECAKGLHTCQQELICENLNGSFTCLCPPGYALGLSANLALNIIPLSSIYNDYSDSTFHTSYNTSSSSSFKSSSASPICLDIDECSIENGQCTHFCMNLAGSFECSCPPGHLLNASDNRTCILVDMCLENNGGCSHACNSMNGQVECSCPEGYRLHFDDRTCLDNNECLISNGGCDHVCHNTAGSFACSCRSGFALSANGRTCLDIDECFAGMANCSSVCVNLLGSYACACEAGFELASDQKTCLDIDECALGRHDCSHDCVNVDGGFQCTCPKGFYLGETRSMCLDIDECVVTDHGCSHNCYNTLGSYMCACPEGLTLSTDGMKCFNERCNTDNGGCSHMCDVVKGCVCPLGWSLGADGKTCEDINECLFKNGFCLHKCHNTQGSFECRCPDDSKPINGEDACPITCSSGYKVSLDDPSKCEDIDECALPGVCEFSCRNTKGSYECLCPSGYRLENGRECVDVDECLENNGGCLGGACVNHNGTFECKCSWGYALSNDRKTCEKRIEMRDQCSPFDAPDNGEIHCTKYRHKRRRFYNTKCKVWCNQGYRLEGPSQRFCNASGQWDDYENKCLPIVCPRIPAPRNGVILPQSCSLGTTYMGEQCRLKCNVGFVPVGKSVAVCNSQMQWSYDGMFECTPIHTERRLSTTNDFKPSVLSTPSIHTTDERNPNFAWKPPSFEGVGVQRPFINCPRNTTVFLTSGERTAHIILEKPVTNLDYRYIESSPAWTRNLQAHLGPGSYAVVFRGYDPVTGRKARCKTVIHVRHAEAPKIEFCTSSFDVKMAKNQAYRSIVWEEPRFESKFPLKKVYKSRIPGELFGIGMHTVFYEATNEDGLTAKCEFTINVREANDAYTPSMPTTNISPKKPIKRGPELSNLSYIAGQRSVPVVAPQSDPQPAISNVAHTSTVNAQLLPGHESFVICPGQKPIKVTHAKTVELPANCILKNVRLSPFRQFTSRQRVLSKSWNSYHY